MNSEQQLDPSKDDLPLRANTSDMLVKHYVLELNVDFGRRVIGGSIVLFLELGTRAVMFCGSDDGQGGVDRSYCHDDEPSTSRQESIADFALVLDCCDLTVRSVEEMDVSSLMGCMVEKEVQKHHLHPRCSQEATGTPLPFLKDTWSLQVSKPGVHRPHDFPRCLRICYETKPEGASVRWSKDQSGRSCVYTVGSPINNRALFPCQEPPVAMSTWQACVRAPRDCTVLLSGENQAKAMPDENGCSCWEYYVTMPMPASTFTMAVGRWSEATVDHAGPDQGDIKDQGSWCNKEEAADAPADRHRSGAARSTELYAGSEMDGLQCSHTDYPCRFASPAARSQTLIPHRVFAPSALLHLAHAKLLPLMSSCLAAAHAVLGVHPFPRLDVLIVPAEFPSLGMASPHVVFLSQSVLRGDKGLCGARLCHEIAHAWFGLAIGARDWTEEWISEGFATYLEDVFWARAQQLSEAQAEDQQHLKALLRWRRLRDELHNSEEELQILRPNKENTGLVSESGASLVKHALNPGKTFMQVHYLKGYFLLVYLADKVGAALFLKFFRQFVNKYHGLLILSQDFLQMFLDHFPDVSRQGLTLEAISADWLDKPGIPATLLDGSDARLQTPAARQLTQEVTKWIHLSRSHRKGSKRKRASPKVNLREVTPEQLVLLLELLLDEPHLSTASLRALEKTYCLQDRDAEVRHRWCELVVKHKHAAAYGHVENFLLQDQAMGVYLYGELMVHEDGRQQDLARRCFNLCREEMDPSARKVVEEMIY